jgi:hypothetical protein
LFLGIRAIARLDGPDVAAKIWDAIEQKRTENNFLRGVMPLTRLPKSDCRSDCKSDSKTDSACQF